MSIPLFYWITCKVSFLTVNLLLRQNNIIEAVELEGNPEKCDVINVIKIIRLLRHNSE